MTTDSGVYKSVNLKYIDPNIPIDSSKTRCTITFKPMVIISITVIRITKYELSEKTDFFLQLKNIYPRTIPI